MKKRVFVTGATGQDGYLMCKYLTQECDNYIVYGLVRRTSYSNPKIKDLLESKNIKINKEDVWGTKPLAYPIKKETSGHYILFNITSETQNIKPIENSMRLYSNLLRFRIFKDEKRIDKKIKPRRKK